MTKFSCARPVWAKDGTGMNTSLLFTAEFPRDERAVLRLTACNFYRVFFNGVFLAYGPARAPRGYSRVDEYVLCGSKEKNEVSIEVAGYRCKSFYAIDRAPFLQAEILFSGGTIATGSVRDFLCRPLSSHLVKTPRYSYQRPFTECRDFTRAPSAPCETAAVEGDIPLPRGVPYPAYGDEDGTEAERGVFSVCDSLPVYRNRCLEQENIGLYPLDELEWNPNAALSRLRFERREGSGTLRAGEYLVFDFGCVRSGFIGARLKAHERTEICFVFDEADPNEGRGTITVSHCRNDSLNFVGCILDGEREFLSFDPYSFRYVKLIVLSGAADVERVFVKKYENPSADGFCFDCGDGKLNAIVRAARNTFVQNAVDLPTDCPGRERAGWLCDGWFISAAEQLFTGSNAVEKNFLENYALLPRPENLPDGMVAMCWPADFEDGNFIPNWAMWYVLELYAYFKRTGDGGTVAASEKNVRGLIRYFEKYLSPEGLLENLEGWVFVEWSKAGEKEFVEGVNFPTNMLYAEMLEKASLLYGDRSLTERANGVRSAVAEYSFNGEFFEDNAVREGGVLRRRGHVSETCQYYAFFTHTADRERYPKLYETLKRDFGAERKQSACHPNVEKSAAFIGFYLRLIVFSEYGEDELVLKDCVSYFYPMAERTGTLWEHGELHASLNHGFASYAAVLIVRCLTGYVGRDEEKKEIFLAKRRARGRFRLRLPTESGPPIELFAAGDDPLPAVNAEGYRIVCI